MQRFLAQYVVGLPVPLKKYARPVAFLILAVATAYGVQQFFASDYTEVLHFWQAKLLVLPLILLLAMIDIGLEAVGWMWVYERFRIRAADRGGIWAYLSSRAGLLLPAQLGRLIRPDAMVRLGRASLPVCLKAEAVAFVLDSTSVVALMVGLAAWLVHPLLALLAALAVTATCLFFGDRIAAMLASTKLAMPKGFWLRWQTFAIVFVEMTGWLANGFALYLIVWDLPGQITWWDPVFFAPASAVLGVGTGLPGGIGPTEGFLGISLKIMQIPGSHLALAIAAFRLLTFWIWIPVGWFALAMIRRRAPKERGADAEQTTAADDGAPPGQECLAAADRAA
jgi:uncharacterized membrane protein YbhN (UPF0104 family)